mmetsp:Transcript_5870/g.16718  ORF Transcript_5870/g.16718 Transcript_5870/m.16718 type:complete len:363 (-) Transcript_5870:109-1197(-)
MLGDHHHHHNIGQGKARGTILVVAAPGRRHDGQRGLADQGHHDPRQGPGHVRELLDLFDVGLFGSPHLPGLRQGLHPLEGTRRTAAGRLRRRFQQLWLQRRPAEPGLRVPLVQRRDGPGDELFLHGFRRGLQGGRRHRRRQGRRGLQHYQRKRGRPGHGRGGRGPGLDRLPGLAGLSLLPARRLRQLQRDDPLDHVPQRQHGREPRGGGGGTRDDGPRQAQPRRQRRDSLLHCTQQLGDLVGNGGTLLDEARGEPLRRERLRVLSPCPQNKGEGERKGERERGRRTTCGPTESRSARSCWSKIGVLAKKLEPFRKHVLYYSIIVSLIGRWLENPLFPNFDCLLFGFSTKNNIIYNNVMPKHE